MSSEDLQETQEKFHKVLEALLNRKFTINNDVYLEMLISHLSGKYSEDHKQFINSPNVAKFLELGIEQWESNEPPDKDVASFTLQILSLNVQNEWNFKCLQENKLIDRYQEAVRSLDKLQHPSVWLGHLLFLKSLATHDAGLNWVKSTESWKIVLDYYNKHQTIYITKEATLFIYEILDKFATLNDDELVQEIIKTLLDPLINDRKWVQSDSQVWVNDEDSQRLMTPLLRMMNQLFRMILEAGKRTKVAYHILITFRFETNLWKYVDTILDASFLGKIWRAHILANFTRLSNMLVPPEDTKTKDLTFDAFTLNFFNYVNFSIRRGMCYNVVMMAEMNHRLWKKLGPRAPEEVVLKNQKIKFGDQLILIQIFPILFVIKGRMLKELGKEKKKIEEAYFEDFCRHLYDISCEFTTRLVYVFRDILCTSGVNATELAIKAVQGISTLKTTLPRNRAIICFQALILSLKEYLPFADCYLENKLDFSKTDIILETPNLLAAVLNGLYDLIENYRITWKECIESTILINYMLNLLYNPNLPPKVGILALKLTQISVEHFLAPNLALLMDNLSGSGLECLGPMIFKRLHDVEWEVRDSTLELLTSIVSISEVKFPAFQRLVLQNNLCTVVEAIAKNDQEPYVKASAFKCLTAMVKIGLFWDKSLAQMNLMNYLLIVFEKEDEGVVRREIVNTITEIYSHHKIQENCLDSVFTLMAFSAVNDLYWEVKLNALSFWRIVMCRQFMHQGMIDGTFPAVTFSKEHKKIITLNDREILLRLKKVLNELSIRGCLGVILDCLDDDCDLEVVKSAAEIVNRLMQCLQKYNYIEERKNIKEKVSPNGVPSTVDQEMASKKSPKRNNADYDSTNICNLYTSDEIIDSIVCLDDVNLLSISYKNRMKVDSNEDCEYTTNEIAKELYEKCKKVSADQFLDNIVGKNFEEMIERRQAWLQKSEGFSSLLDDILYSYYAAEVNDTDCY